MMDWYENYVLAVRRHQDDIRRAEEYRLAQLPQDGEANSPEVKWYDRQLSRVGDTLVWWGERLQARACRPAPIRHVSLNPKT